MLKTVPYATLTYRKDRNILKLDAEKKSCELEMQLDQKSKGALGLIPVHLEYIFSMTIT